MDLYIEQEQDTDIAFTALRELWLWYDCGGTSWGRSVRSRYLELARDILPLVMHEIPPRQALKRWIAPQPAPTQAYKGQQLVLFDNLRYLADATIVSLILQRLLQTYDQEAKDTWVYDVEILKIALGNLAPPESADAIRAIPNDALIGEAERRKSVISQLRWSRGWIHQNTRLF